MYTPPRRRTFGLALTACCSLAGTASSQPLEDVAHVSVELESGWTLESAVVDGELLGFFAWIPEAEVTPGNVHLAWLEHVGGGAWVMFGWDDSTSADAVSAVELYLADEAALEGVDTESIDGSERQTDNCGGPVLTGGGEAMPAGATLSDPASPLLRSDRRAAGGDSDLSDPRRFRCERGSGTDRVDARQLALPGGERAGFDHEPSCVFYSRTV